MKVRDSPAHTAVMSTSPTSYWWDRSDRPGRLEAVIFSLDALLADSRADERLLAEAVWDLHCAGIRVAVVTAGHWPAVHRPVRELLGDGAVEVLVTGDEVSRPKPDPEVYRHALWQLGVRPLDAMAVEARNKRYAAIVAGNVGTRVGGGPFEIALRGVGAFGDQPFGLGIDARFFKKRGEHHPRPFRTGGEPVQRLHGALDARHVHRKPVRSGHAGLRRAGRRAVGKRPPAVTFDSSPGA
jgi:hypothetical protein